MRMIGFPARVSYLVNYTGYLSHSRARSEIKPREKEESHGSSRITFPAHLPISSLFLNLPSASNFPSSFISLSPYLLSPTGRPLFHSFIHCVVLELTIPSIAVPLRGYRSQDTPRTDPYVAVLRAPYYYIHTKDHCFVKPRDFRDG